MVENVGRKLFWIAALLVASLLMIVLPRQPFRLGLDLQGGTRLVYRIDFEQALQQEQITADEYANRRQLLQDTLDIIRERVDPNGVLEASFRAQGEDEFVIEIPRTASLPTVNARGSLAEDLRAGEAVLTLTDITDDMLAAFSSSGGVVGIRSERIGYGSRIGKQLHGLRRGSAGTLDGDHPAGSTVELVSDDAIKQAIENPGALHFYLAATTADYPPQTDPQTERRKVTEWLEANPRLPIRLYNALPFPEGPPHNIRWFPMRLKERDDPTVPVASRLEALAISEDPEWRFDGQDLKTVNSTQDEYNYPSVGFEMNPSASHRFGQFTEANVQRGLAIVVNDEIVTLANIRQPLYGRAQISGGQPGFTRAEVDAMVKVLRSGSFKIKPELREEERVGASLGDRYIRNSAISGILGISIVLSFMVIYYRRLGAFAAASLLANLLLLMGAMAFLKATLTLPGVAGIILTVGMAVDANILIFERIREESRKGRKIAQAAKNGFERAMVTIIDANVTTFITAAILREVGTGPIRGFATTLMIGIATSMFAALVITRILVHFAILKGPAGFKMSQLVKDTNIRFMGMAKKCLTGSAVLIVAGVGLFISVPDKDKLSIDFLGGFTVTVRTEEPQSPERIRALVTEIPGSIGKADVAPILDSGSRADGFRQFRITYKAESGAVEAAERAGISDVGEKTGESEIREALKEVLQRGPVDVRADDPTSAITGRIYFEEAHLPADIAGVMGELGMTGVVVTPDDRYTGAYEFRGSLPTATSARELVTVIAKIFEEPTRRDSAGARYRLAQPVPESTVVGAQVVGKLRDRAIAAILLSLFAAVLYIRVRFAEYSYGFAAVAAIVHDILIVLGVLAIADYTKFIDGQISLPMIAAFLTIIGYSLNDTIVVFDRIRENLPRMKGTLPEILDVSINQTLSRTILTSFTTLLAVSVLLAFNYGGGSVLEGFAFALLVGILVGTYSSIFVASPVFLWLEQRAARRAAA